VELSLRETVGAPGGADKGGRSSGWHGLSSEINGDGREFQS
jgi:hypothetical protein